MGRSNNTHVSNTGWGPWSVNLGQVLQDPTQQPNAAANLEWNQLFVGQNGNYVGRYGPDKAPGTNGTPASIYPPLTTSLLTPSGTISTGNSALTRVTTQTAPTVR